MKIFQTPPATIAPLVREAFLNLSLGLAFNEKVFTEGMPGVKLVLDDAPLPVQGALLGPGQKLVVTRKVLTDKGLFLYYSTNNGVLIAQADKSKSGGGTAEVTISAKDKIYASGMGGNTEEKGDTFTMTITNKSKKPCFVVIVAMILRKPAGANVPLIPAVKNLSEELPKALMAQKTGSVPLNTMSFYGQALAPKALFAAGKPGQVLVGAGSNGPVTVAAGQATNAGAQLSLCVLGALNP
jgi:hypothetical protein